MTQSDNKKAPYKRGDVVRYKEGNGVALVVKMYLGVAGINWIVVPTSGVYNEWFFRDRHPECDFYVETDSLGEVLCHVPIPGAGAKLKWRK